MGYLSALSWTGITFLVLSILAFLASKGGALSRSAQLVEVSLEGADAFEKLLKVMGRSKSDFEWLSLARLKEAEDRVHAAAVKSGGWSFSGTCGLALLLGGIFWSSTWVLLMSFLFMAFSIDTTSVAFTSKVKAELDKKETDPNELLIALYVSVYMLIGMKASLSKGGTRFTESEFQQESATLVLYCRGLIAAIDQTASAVALGTSDTLAQANAAMEEQRRFTAELKAIKHLALLNCMPTSEYENLDKDDPDALSKRNEM